MRVFLLAAALKEGLGYAVGQRLLAAGHSVAALVQSVPANWNWGVEWVVGQFGDTGVQREIERADAVIDADLPVHFEFKGTKLDGRRPSLLRQALKGSGKPLIVTSSASVLGDTGPVPVGEDALLHTPSNYAYLARLEEDVRSADDICGVVIRPDIEHGPLPAVNPVTYWESLADRLGKGTYIEPGTNCWSAVHRSDLADLYCLALQQARPGMLVHAASETFSMRELADAIHCSMGLAGGAGGIPYEEALKLTRAAPSLCRSRAISGAMAQRELGWHPVGTSLLDEVRKTDRTPLSGSR